MYKIGTLNKISPVGLARLTDDYTVIEDVAEANGIILRSYDMHEMELSDNLLGSRKSRSWCKQHSSWTNVQNRGSWYSMLRVLTPTQ